jgi:hypothetical protein
MASENTLDGVGEYDAEQRPGGIGSRDLRLFNHALLARQAWRLLQNPDTLCA